MSFFEYASAHPVWTLIYLFVVGSFICSALGR